MQHYAIGLGSNRRHGRHGAPARVLSAALAAIADSGIRVTAVSPILATPALGPAGRSFANAAALLATDAGPPALLATLKAIERRFGRRRGRRWGARVLDLDVLLWSGGRWPPRGVPGPGRLTVPHAALVERDFVLAPLAAIAPGWRLPGGISVRQARHRLRRARALG